MGLRHDAREWALQFLFQSEFNRADSLDEGFQLFWRHQDPDSSLAARPLEPPRRLPTPKARPRPGSSPKNSSAASWIIIPILMP
jgi:transcription termination factor NusB